MVKPPRAILLAALVSLAISLPAFPKSRKNVAERKKHSESQERLTRKRSSAFLPFESKQESHPRDDSPAEAAKFFLQRRLGEGQKVLPTQRYLEAAEQIKKMPLHSTATEAHKRALGDASSARREIDANLQAGLQTWTPLGPGNVGGRTRALVIDPGNPAVMYAAGVGGGVWKTVDGGNSWNALTDMMGNIAVTALAMDPSNHNVIYAGTGEGYFNFDAIPGAGVFKTTDAGATWTRMPSSALDVYFQFINKIVVSPHDPQTIYAATGTGVWVSSAGQPFTPIFFSAGTSGDGCQDLVARNDQPTDYLFAACGQFEPVTIYRFIAGQNGTNGWQPVLSVPLMGRTSLALAPSNQGIIYAMGMRIGQDHDHNYALKAVYRSTSNGDPNTWTIQNSSDSDVQLNTLLLTNPQAATATSCGVGENFFSNQGWYDNVLAVDPTNPNRLWAGGIDLFRSDDGGVNWGLASYWWAEGNPQYAHADQHAIVFHPQYNGTSNRTMYVTNDGGLYKTDDALATTAMGPNATCDPSQAGFAWSNINNGYGVTLFYQGAPYPGGSQYLGGTQDNGTLKGSQGGGPNWTRLLGGDGGFVAVDPTNTNILYASHPGMQMEKSIDGGATWSRANNLINDFGLFVTPFVMDPTQPTRLWTGGAYIWRTNNGGASWQYASSLTQGNGLVSAIAVSPSNPEVVAVGMSDGWVLTNTQASSADLGTQWHGLVVRYGFISSLAFDPTNSSVLYATSSTVGSFPVQQHVYKSTDGGNTWQGIDGSGTEGIPDVPVNAIAVSPIDSSRLYVGTDSGVFVSLDSGQHWAFENSGFANVVTEALQVEPTSGSLFAFTHGRGAWKVGLQPEALRIVPSLLDFGLQFEGHASTALQVQITNLSGGPITVTNVQINGVFAQTNSCGTLPAGGNCSISVTVTPTVIGLTSGTLTITYDSGSFAIPLRATGYTGPAVSLTPTNIDFGTVPTQSVSAAQSITLTNTGNGDLHIANIFFDGLNPGFTKQNECPDTVHPGVSCHINVRLENSSYTNSTTTNLNLYTDAVTSPDHVSLSATLSVSTELTVPSFSIISSSTTDPHLTFYFFLFHLSANGRYRIDGQDRPTSVTSNGAIMTLLPQDLVPGQHTLTLYDPNHNPPESAPGVLLVYNPMLAQGLVFDPYSRLIFVRPIIQSVGGMPGFIDPGDAAKIASNNTVLAVDADSKTVVRRITIPSAYRFTVSSDGKYLYTVNPWQKMIYRYNIQQDMVETAFSVWNVPQYNAPNGVTAVPGDDLGVIVTTDYGNGFVYENGVLAPSYSHSLTANLFEPGDPLQGLLNRDAHGDLLPNSGAPATLYSLNNVYQPNIERVRVDASGATDLNGVSGNFGSDLKSANGLLYTDNGLVLDANDFTILRSYEGFSQGAYGLHPGIGQVAPDPGRNIIQVFSTSSLPGNTYMDVFDLTTLTLKSEVLSPPYLLGGIAPFVETDADTVASIVGGQIGFDGVYFFKDARLNPYQPPNAPSSVTGISPASITSQSGNFLLQVSGSGFTPGSYLMWSGKKKTTNYVSTSSLIAYIPASDVAQPGTANITVGNPETAPSNTATFAISAASVAMYPQVLKFGTGVLNRRSAWQSVSIVNNGTAAINIGTVSATNNNYVTDSDCGLLAAGGTCNAYVAFSPSSTGDQFGAIKIQVGTNAVPMAIPVAGTGFDFTLNVPRPTRPHRSGGQASAASRATVEISLGGDASSQQFARLSCNVPSNEFVCKVSPDNLMVGGPSVNATVTLKRRTARRLGFRSSHSLPIAITATSNGLTRTALVH